MKLTLFVVLALAAETMALPATSAEYDFLLHVNAHSTQNGMNCGPGGEWSAKAMTCGGTAAPDGRSTGFNGGGSISVQWCDKGPTCYLGEWRTLPQGYGRWMKFCVGSGNDRCGKNTSWLLGAVSYPNGPFHVMGGMINGKAVAPDDGDQRRIAQPGGPLNLVVTYKGYHSNGGGTAASELYTFGIVGKIRY